MSLTLMLDTVTAIAILNDKLVLPDSAILYLPIISLGELYAGAEHSARIEENIRRIETLARRCEVVMCNHDTARYYGRIVAALRKKGRPINPPKRCLDRGAGGAERHDAAHARYALPAGRWFIRSGLVDNPVP